MGSSKYEFNPWQLDQDCSDREYFYACILAGHDDSALEPRDLFKRLMSRELYSEAVEIYRSNGYQFLLTLGGYEERITDYCYKRMIA